jgi:hypothetical protein
MSFKSFEKNIQSQFGEDGVIEEIFKRIGYANKICVEFGAWNGVHLSNTWNLWNRQDWVALLIEGDTDKYQTLVNTTRDFGNVRTLNVYVSSSGNHSLDSILGKYKFPHDIDLLSVDVDGDEYYLFNSLTKYLPRVVIAEYNPTIPPDREIVQVEGGYFGSSALSLLNLAHSKGYKLAHVTTTNIFFVHQTAFNKLLIDEPSLEDIFIKNNLTYLISSYDGQTFMAGNASYTRFESMPAATTPPEIISERTDIRKVIVELPEHRSSQTTGLKSALKKTFIYPLWRYWKEKKEVKKEREEQEQELRDWESKGKPVPPPQLYKREVLKKYGASKGIKTFIETGTYLGETVSYLKNDFDKLISIELDTILYEKAKKKFSRNKRVHIYKGDSGVILRSVLKDISAPCLFWLDGHYSNGITAKGRMNTPVLQELDHILNHKTDGHIILIDDARCFTGKNDYPTILYLESYIRQMKKGLQFLVQDDIIRIHK